MSESRTPADLIPENGLVIEFPEVSSADASRRAAELEKILTSELIDARSAGSVQRLRKDPEAQDLGSYLRIILDARAMTALVRGITQFLTLHPQSKLRFTKDKDLLKLDISGVRSGDIPAILNSIKMFMDK